MKMITGLIETTSGEILFQGEPIQRDLIAYKQRMGYVPEEPHLYAHLSGLEYLVMVGQLRDLPAQAHRRPHRRTAAPVLAPRRPPRAHLGLLERHAPESAALGGAAAQSRPASCSTNPSPASTLAPALVLRSLIQELAARGKVVLFSSHELETVERVCSHVVILHRGKIVADDSIEHLRTLMSLPTLEDIFSQLAVEQDTAAISREIADLIQA